MFKEIKSMFITFKPKLNALKDSVGTTLTEQAEILNRWKEYCSEMNINRGEKDNRANTEIITEKEPEPTLEEVEWAIKKLEDGKITRM
uniref:Uncharacterized protein n=1 Tax=Arion vulgaris TaxID=1028688 RepID=A0A0B7BKJ0_9EUPU